MASRSIGFFLCVALSLPGPAFALRPQLERTGLEEALRPTAGLEEKAPPSNNSAGSGKAPSRLLKWVAATLLGGVLLFSASHEGEKPKGLPEGGNQPLPADVLRQERAWNLFQQELARITRLNEEEKAHLDPEEFTQQKLQQELVRIDRLAHLNGVPIEEIERRARPGQEADTGFLGYKEGLKAVLKPDRITEFQLKKSHRWFGKHLKRITLLAQKGAEARDVFDMPYLGQSLRVSYVGTLGYQTSILANGKAGDGRNPDNWSWRHEMTVVNLRNGLHVLVGGDVRADGGDGIAYGLTGYIERYGFYEGGGRRNPWRVDPAVLEAILTGRPATAELRQKESIPEREYQEEQYQKRIRALLEAEKKAPLHPEAERAFRAILGKLPPPVLRELLDLAKRRHLDYWRKFAGEYPEKYGYRARYSFASGKGDSMESFELLVDSPDGKQVLRLNLTQQTILLEDYLRSVREKNAGMEEDPPGFLNYQRALAQQVNQNPRSRFLILLDQQGMLESVSVHPVLGEDGLDYPPMLEDPFSAIMEDPSEYRLLGAIAAESLLLINVNSGKVISIFGDGTHETHLQADSASFWDEARKAVRELLETIGESTWVDSVKLGLTEGSYQGSLAMEMDRRREMVRLVYLPNGVFVEHAYHRPADSEIFGPRGNEELQGGLEELMDVARGPVRAVAERGERIAVLVDSAVAPDASAADLDAITQHLRKMNGYPMIEIRPLAPGARDQLLAAGVRVMQLRALTEGAAADPDTVYVQAAASPRGISTQALPLLITDAIGRWQNAQGRARLTPIILPAAPYLHLGGLEEGEIADRILADRFA